MTNPTPAAGRPNVAAEQARTKDKEKDSPVQQSGQPDKDKDYLVSEYHSTIDEDDPNSGIDPDQMTVNPGT
jgi:hypothetical protein